MLLPEAMEAVDYRGLDVQKPWGHEYLAYQDHQAAVWHLFLEGGRRTSLHCHPRKKTGLILVAGQAVVSFLSDETVLRAPAKLMIRAGLFHATAALGGGAELLEIETPVDKANLVRLEDGYGREQMPYEGPDALRPLAAPALVLESPAAGGAREYRVGECVLTMSQVESAAGLRSFGDDPIIAVLDGGLFSDSGEPILTVGDVVGRSTLSRLSESFEAPGGALLLSVRAAGE